MTCTIGIFILLQRTKLDSLLKDYAFTPIFLRTSAYQKALSNTTRALCDIVTTNRSAATTNHTVQLMSPFTELTLFDSGLLQILTLRLWYLQFDCHIGYSVCTNRCNIGCGSGSLLSMVTSHLLAVPNTESTNCYNLWLVCLRHLQPLARHSLSSLISDFVSTFDCCLRLRFFGFATSSFTTLVLPCACSTIASGGLPRIWKLSLPYSLELP